MCAFVFTIMGLKLPIIECLACMYFIFLQGEKKAKNKLNAGDTSLALSTFTRTIRCHATSLSPSETFDLHQHATLPSPPGEYTPLHYYRRGGITGGTGGRHRGARQGAMYLMLLSGHAGGIVWGIDHI